MKSKRYTPNKIRYQLCMMDYYWSVDESKGAYTLVEARKGEQLAHSILHQRAHGFVLPLLAGGGEERIPVTRLWLVV
jgi:hypothetical protein